MFAFALILLLGPQEAQGHKHVTEKNISDTF
jgi:hypothetical protein